MKIAIKNRLLWALIFIPYFALLFGIVWYYNMLHRVNSSSFILISKQDMKLYQYNYKGDLLQECKIACGKNSGFKTTEGDLKTPEGIFKIIDVEDASKWSHDFKDGKGEILGAYGPYFIRLNVPGQKGIGIHGTHLENSIGLRTTEGCIRIPNKELVKLVKNIKSSSVVIITPSQIDVDSTKN